MSNPTPTPWDKDAIFYLLRFGHKHSGPWEDHGQLPDEDDADLIAAAPDLLEALEDAAETFRTMFFHDEALRDHYPWIGESLKKADAAIAKAKGENNETV